MNKTLEKAIKQTLESWSTLSDEQKGLNFENSKTRLEEWLKELQNESK